MSETLTFMDGTEIVGAHVMEDGAALWFYVQGGMTMAEVFALTNDPEKTGEITARRFGEKTVYSGYTDLRSIRKDGTQVSGCLQKA